MTAQTLIVSLLFLAMGLWVRPGLAVGLLVVSMLAWPEYLRVKVGPAQMSVARILALGLFVRFAIAGRLPRAEWRWVDSVVMGWWAWDVAANALAGADSAQMNYVIGRGLDTWLMYFVARMGVRDLREFRLLFAPLAVSAGWMMIAGVFESVTTNGLYDRMFAHHGWLWIDKGQEFRLGFMRAKGSTAHPIYWGMTGVILCGLLGSLYEVRRRGRAVWWGAAACGLIGALTCLSSGPQMGLVLLLICGGLSFAKPMIRPALWVLLALCVLVEFASNRHFYNLVDYLAFNSGTAWYRTRLMEVAAAHWHEYALFGVANNIPQHWGEQIDGRQHVDVVNNYIIVVLSGGFLGLALYVSAGVGALRRAVRSARGADRERRGVLYGLGATLVALGTASQSVGLYGPPLLLSFMLVGLLISLTEPRGIRTSQGMSVSAKRVSGTPE